MYINSLHVFIPCVHVYTSNHDSGTCISIAEVHVIPWLLLIHDYVYSNHDSGTWFRYMIISIAYTFIPWLLLIMIQVHVYL